MQGLERKARLAARLVRGRGPGDGPQFAAETRVFPPATFLRMYSNAPGAFACMSFCCIPRTALKRLGREPFRLRLCEDGYFCHRLAPLGDVVYSTAPMVAYRIRSGSLSSDWMRVNSAEVEALERLEQIASVPGVDALFVGPGDLSAAMGHLG